MKNIKITYNPYILRTDILIDGKTPAPNSALNFGKKRVQEWSTELPGLLLEECSDRNFQIEFTGLQTDFDDLKCALDSASDFNFEIVFNSKPSVAEVEKEVDKIFSEIQNGPVPQLRDKSILEAFRRAKNQQFEINVVATMSSGKSTLINALLDKKLMPVANMATTATIVKIINDPDAEQGHFSAVAYDGNGRKIREDADITYKVMKEWNADASISSIEIRGIIPCATTVGMSLVLVDTPGPNNSQDESHRQKTYKMLEESDKSLVLFVMNARQLNINDQKRFMDHVYKCMEKGGKQSRERYIFAINQMDSFNPEDDNPAEALDSAQKVLEKYHIDEPNLFPVSALVALECRTEAKIPEALPVFRAKVEEYDEMKFDSYYDYNNLPMPVRHNIEGLLKGATEEEKLEIHSGIVSIEEAIGQYITKYARALKVKDLVDSFNNRLTELKAIAEVESEIRKNKAKKAKLDEAIGKIRVQIESGNSAKALNNLIDKKDLSGEVGTDIKDFVNDTMTNINRIIDRYTNNNLVPKDYAFREVKSVRDESKDILAQMDSRISTILERGYRNLFQDIIDVYRDYLSELGMSISSTDMGLKPLDFVAEELKDLNYMINQNTEMVDEGYDETRTRMVNGEKKTNWFWKPWQWGSERYEQIEEEYEVHISNWQEYVYIGKVVFDYVQPLQIQLKKAKKAAEEHADMESKRLKQMLKAQIERIDSLLQKKMDDLQKSTAESAQTAERIKLQEENLKWMSAMIERVNHLVEF